MAFSDTYPVSDEKVDFFRDNGYVRFDGVLSSDEVDTVREALAKAMEAKRGFQRDLAGGGDKIVQMVNLWEHEATIREYSTSKRLAEMAKRLTGSDSIRLFHDQALVKKPGPSAPSPWHQDQPYWPSKEPGMISCWMALDHVTIDRGAMQFVPGSHKWGEFDPVAFDGNSKSLKEMVGEEIRAKWNAVPVELNPGDCTWHHGLTYHFTRANTTEQVRRAMVTIYIPEGVNFAADEKMEHPLSPTITSEKGEPLRGTKFLELA